MGLYDHPLSLLFSGYALITDLQLRNVGFWSDSLSTGTKCSYENKPYGKPLSAPFFIGAVCNVIFFDAGLAVADSYSNYR